MTGSRRPLAGLAAAATLVALVAAGRGAAAPRSGHASYRDGPPPAHTGGFGEPTCRACHFGAPPDEPPGRLEIEAPGAVRAGGEPVVLRVRLSHPELAIAGFQLAVRCAGGGQAGRLEAVGSGVAVDEEGGVQYARHTRAGARMAESGRATWSVRWWPPRTGGIPAIVHVAANASNDDDSELGDRIYADSLTVAVRRGEGPRFGSGEANRARGERP